MKNSPPVSSSASAGRRARLAAVVANAKAQGKKIPRGVKLIGFREPTAAERDFGKPLARKRAKAVA